MKFYEKFLTCDNKFFDDFIKDRRVAHYVKEDHSISLLIHEKDYHDKEFLEQAKNHAGGLKELINIYVICEKDKICYPVGKYNSFELNNIIEKINNNSKNL